MSIFSNKINMLEGSLWDKIILFAIPLAMMSFFEQLFNIADVATLGRFVGKEAVAAVGNNLALIGLFVNLFIGLSLGTNVVIARCIGGRKFELADKAIHTSLLLSLLVGAVITVLGEVLTNPILQLLAVPIEVSDMAEIYLRLYLLGLPFISLYNFEAAIFRSKGNTKTPLEALIVAVILNAILNILFIVFLPNPVAGVALATVISMLIGSAILFHNLNNSDDAVSFKAQRFHFEKDLLKDILTIGWPAAVQGMVFCIANILIQQAINSLGPDVMAASSIAMTLELAVYCVIIAFAQAGTTFIGQNYGAGKFKRCKSIAQWCLFLDLVFTLVLCTFVMILAEPIIKLFNDDPKVIELTIERLWYVLVPEFIQIFIDVFSGIMRGYGFSLAPAILTVSGICLVRLLWLYTAFAWHSTYGMLMLVYPISWTVAGILVTGLYIYFSLHLMRYLHRPVRLRVTSKT